MLEPLVVVDNFVSVGVVVVMVVEPEVSVVVVV